MTVATGNLNIPSGEQTPKENSASLPKDFRWKTKTCPFWIIGKCQLADEDCKYMHVYNLDNLPDCQYKFEQDCPKGTDCIYKHIKDERHDCPYYLRGFCKLCRNSINNIFKMKKLQYERKNNGFKVCALAHRQRHLCSDYMVGFCPKGPKCQDFHPKPQYYHSLSLLPAH